MTFRDLNLKFSYESGIDDLVQDFYVPVLNCAISYDRIAGFFSSSSLSVAAKGIVGLIKNSGRMRLLACPKLSSEDYEIIRQTKVSKQEIISNNFIKELNALKNEFQRDHIKALGWMLKHGYLEIKLVEVLNDKEISNKAIFHQKVGVLKDTEGNVLSFSGSVNESASGWFNNVEEFKVFRYWIEGQEEFVVSDNNKFEQFWNKKRDNVMIYELPEAISNNLIEIADNFSVENFCVKYYIKKNKHKELEEKLSLFLYQLNALEEWEKNDYKLLFEMATGTGKTRTAIGCVNKVLELEKNVIVIISCPQNTLSMQWKKEMIEDLGIEFDCEIVADSSNRKWRAQLEVSLKKISIGLYKTAIIFTTHKSGSSKDFLDIVQKFANRTPICFVGDEAHGLGAYKNKKGLLELYRYRIGLSATPSRWFDELGTNILTNYFGEKSFEFSISKALSTINPLTNKPFLVNYYYNPIFVKLTEDEIEGYKKLSNMITKMSKKAKDDEEYQKRFEALLFARAAIQKNAEEKYSALENVLRNLKLVSDTIIFVSDEQIDSVMNILKNNNIFAHRFTQDQGTKPSLQYDGQSERQYLIKQFRNKNLKALVAISCLDEGIDIPSADTAILMASSTNPREYIQRVGRVIRQAPEKGNANIYDFVIEPDLDNLQSQELIKFERAIFRTEMNRVCEMASNAINNASVQVAIDERMRRLDEYGNE
ncbi:DEAD/DEAH box helicase family protein [Clostridium sp. ZBS17]|uniref:DEAD/DEAH box helicase family protein n=1 Tax=Clostridium sp. ZBS17 TaxID=2949968 RepID=UPI00207A524F|nr:DEAD/DEAH box helicase family protein [Clostridium sp. ZBS17]